MADIAEVVDTIARESGLGREALVRFFSGTAFPAFIRALEELGDGEGWIALNIVGANCEESRIWPSVSGGKALVGGRRVK